MPLLHFSFFLLSCARCRPTSSTLTAVTSSRMSNFSPLSDSLPSLSQPLILSSTILHRRPPQVALSGCDRLVCPRETIFAPFYCSSSSSLVSEFLRQALFCLRFASSFVCIITLCTMRFQHPLVRHYSWLCLRSYKASDRFMHIAAHASNRLTQNEILKSDCN